MLFIFFKVKKQTKYHGFERTDNQSNHKKRTNHWVKTWEQSINNSLHYKQQVYFYSKYNRYIRHFIFSKNQQKIQDGITIQGQSYEYQRL